MSGETDLNRFRDALMGIHRDFLAQKAEIAAEQGGEDGPILERRARRFLVDRYLHALGWDTNDPTVVQEEGRGTGDKAADRLYFDFLGWNPKSEVPALLVEAKLFDHEQPREPHKAVPTSQAMRPVLATAIERLKTGKSSGLVAVWDKILNEVKTYVQALARGNGEGPYRTIITSGDWIILFDDPVETFSAEGTASAEHIYCFMSFSEILDGAAKIFSSLYRPNVVDTLPAVLDVSEALKILPKEIIGSFRRGVCLGTRIIGPDRREYPSRSVYPALIVDIGTKRIGICDLDAPLDAPRKETGWPSFFGVVDLGGEALLNRLDMRFGPALKSKLKDELTPFVAGGAAASIPCKAPVLGSTMNVLKTPALPEYRLRLSDRKGPFFLVGTGAKWFYRGESLAQACQFHSHEKAVSVGKGQSKPHLGYAVNSFTEAQETGHCAHSDLLNHRSSRCQVEDFDSHLCCQGCVFLSHCWTREETMPCPDTHTVADTLQANPCLL